MLYQILALLIWSSSLIVGKLTYSMMDPVLVVQVRLIIAMIIVMPLFFTSLEKLINQCVNSFGGWHSLTIPPYFFIAIHRTKIYIRLQCSHHDWARTAARCICRAFLL